MALLLPAGTVLETESDTGIGMIVEYTVCLVVAITLESFVCISVTVTVGVMALSVVDDASSLVCRSEEGARLLPLECVLGSRLVDVVGVNVGRSRQ